MTNYEIIELIYSSSRFQRIAYDVVDQLSNLLNLSTDSNSKKCIEYKAPAAMYDYWRNYSFSTEEQLVTDFISHSIQIHHPKYMGHQVVPPAPDAITAAFLGIFLNNGGAVYEMGMSSNALEMVVIDWFKPYFGYEENSGGIMTSGGTLANLTALLTARAIKCPDVWRSGYTQKIAFMVSEEAHYCIDRAARIMGLGDDGIIKIPVNESYTAQIDLLESLYLDTQKRGIKVIGIVGSAPTTSTGKFDDLEAMGNFAKKYQLWFHIDAAHGGPAVFSDKYKHLMRGSQLSDSITIDGHKMMMIPSLSTMLLYKDAATGYHTFHQQASYLWQSDDIDWADAGKRTFECTKLVMSLRFYFLIKIFGRDGFKAFVETCFDMAKDLADMIIAHDQFELAVYPDANIVCFRTRSTHSLEGITYIRRKLIEKSAFYIVQTQLKNIPYFRVSLMNPLTSKEDLSEMLSSILTIEREFLDIE